MAQFSYKSWNRYFACDFMTVDTLFLKRLFLFSIKDVTTREIVRFSDTSNPRMLWLENVIRSIFSTIENLPEILVSDRDGIYGEWFGTYLDECYNLKLLRTPPRCPNCNAFIERWHRSIREEMLDHTLVFGKRDLQRLFQNI